MSTSLYWKEIPKEEENKNINSLKWILSEKIWGTDGSCGQPETKIGEELIPFLEGIIATENDRFKDDAKSLLDAIKKHGNILLYSNG